ncbi:lytic transglycosylase domain-containing protein [Pseudaminobacter soli (ex Li et al. 2025)]|uniref:Lytic transglycosylase n=1 Tax=Pseudaminobacter soli (ex Li et al. 2025) TaxID=1295366 RepID=A0A2P7SMD9_9HYPH|nr:transglycosylase SLT domain-containing protein [Mesorhizobium soli]PSJ63664.1 lytic transglycosylase [Mesorhizobium soli]
MKRMTAMAAAIAAAFTSFAANAQPLVSKDSDSADNASVVSAVDGNNSLPGVWGSNNSLDLTAAHGMRAKKGKAARVKHSKHSRHHASLGGKHRVKVALNTRGGGLPGVDPVRTGSIAQNAAAATPQLAKAQYSTIVSRYAAAYGVPAELAHAVIKVESNYRANARGGAGEIGLMQIKPATARMMGYSGGASGLFNPETNIKYGMKYLAQAHSLSGGTTCGTILKYNAGHGAKRMNPVSAAYCSKVKQQLAMN